jgi:hypothetical protein
MYVEDLFIVIFQRLCETRPRHAQFGGLLDGEWHRNFIQNVSCHILAGNQLSSNQSRTILKLIAKVRHYLVAYGMATDDDIAGMLHQPEHRRPLYASIEIPREVRHVGDNLLGFRYKQNDLITQRIKKLGEPALVSVRGTRMRIDLIDRPRFDWPTRIWVVPVFRHNLEAIFDLIREYRFGIDVLTAGYLRLAAASLDQPSTFGYNIEHDLIQATVRDNPLLAGWIAHIAEGVAV